MDCATALETATSSCLLEMEQYPATSGVVATCDTTVANSLTRSLLYDLAQIQNYNASLAGTATPTPSATPVPSSTPAPTSTPEPAPQYGTAVINAELIKRDQPSVNGAAVGSAYAGESYQVINMQEAEGYTWYQLSDNTWVASEGTWVTYQ